MINMSEIWVRAGRPDGRRPSNFKATAAVKRFLAGDAGAWIVEGRGAKSVTYACQSLANAYESYVVTPKRGAGAQAKAASGSTGPDTGEARYTAADMRAAYQGGYKDGHEVGYSDGYANGKRSAGMFGMGDVKFTATKQQCQEARRTFARKYHPDHNHGGLRDMQIINAVFDEIERIFNQAA